jgi:hypothetical protein
VRTELSGRRAAAQARCRLLASRDQRRSRP